MEPKITTEVRAESSTLSLDPVTGNVFIKDPHIGDLHSIAEWAQPHMQQTPRERCTSMVVLEVIDQQGKRIGMRPITFSTPPQVIDGVVSFAATGRNVADLTVRVVEEFRQDPRLN